jgi:hypothetical protein
MDDERELIGNFGDGTGNNDIYGGGSNYDWRQYAPSGASYYGPPQRYNPYDDPYAGRYDYGRRLVSQPLPPSRYRPPPRYSPWYDDYEDDACERRRSGGKRKAMEFLKNIAGSVLVAIIAGLIIRSIERSVVRYKEKKLEDKEKAAKIADETLNKYFPSA